MEGNRHLLTAKRMAFDLGLHSVSDPDISTYAYDSGLQDTAEKSAVFWQVFIVDRFWSAANHCDVTLPDKLPYQYPTTPLPVRDGTRLVSPSMILVPFRFQYYLGLGCQRHEQSYLRIIR